MPTKPLQNCLLVEKRIAKAIPPLPIIYSMLENIGAEGYCGSRIIHQLHSELLKVKGGIGVISQAEQEIIPCWIPRTVSMSFASSIGDD
jgi:hypothetical protein